MKMEKTKRGLCLFLCLAIILCTLPSAVYAASANPTEKIMLSPSKDLKQKGFFWDASEKTLTLDNADIYGFYYTPKTGDVTIELKGESKLHGAIYAGSRDSGDLTIKGGGKGALTIDGFIYYGSNSDITIKNCVLSVTGKPYFGDSVEFAVSDPGYGIFRIIDARVYLYEGLNAGSQLIMDNSYLEVGKTISNYTFVDIDHSAEILNGSVFRVNMQNIKRQNPVIVGTKFYADPSSSVEIVTDADHAIQMEYGSLEILSKSILLKSKDALFQSPISYTPPDLNKEPVYTLNPEIAGNYVSKIEESSPELNHVVLYEKGREDTPVTEISYTSAQALQEKEQLKQEIKDTNIKLKSTLTGKGNIKLTWTKPDTYTADYYQVYRSTKRYSGYTNKPFYTTTFGMKDSYTNTKDMKKGTRYYYKVRGVKEIDGQKYYTPYSNKAWRKA